MRVTLSNERLSEAGLLEPDGGLRNSCRLCDAGKLSMLRVTRKSRPCF
jgi:hypothetical protein